MTEEEPLIYTTKGNIPISQLDYVHYWEDALTLKVVPSVANGQMSLSIEKDGQMTFIEEYYEKTTQELVKRNVAVYRFKGQSIASEQGNLN
jgi:hypothetical protein